MMSSILTAARPIKNGLLKIAPRETVRRRDCVNLFISSHQIHTDTAKKCPYNIVFLRHGQSTWNRDNRFIGWTDTPLTEEGVIEARAAGQALSRSGIQFDAVHTSLLRRAIRTTNVVLMELGQEYIPVHKHFRLNERMYGSLVGLNKKECVKQFGKEQVKRWRRSYDEPPPPMDPATHPFWPGHDPRYKHMIEQIPLHESLKCTVKRSSVYWDSVIAPALLQGKSVLVVGHENNLRSLLMRLEQIPEQDIIQLNLPRAMPLAYKLDENLKPVNLRADGSLDDATGFLQGTWLGGDDAVSKILKRDEQQVYDTSIQENLEIGSKSVGESWKTWMDLSSSRSAEKAPLKRRHPVLNGSTQIISESFEEEGQARRLA
mmetsp:Transcript_3848/g.5722  ORF Transcript_3848/g.5722 Transcript_3848/m.5722 type:complete len:374 (+) Transcript_3848:169-1290(+)